jgi:hypothetical protein
LIEIVAFSRSALLACDPAHRVKFLVAFGLSKDKVLNMSKFMLFGLSLLSMFNNIASMRSLSHLSEW